MKFNFIARQGFKYSLVGYFGFSLGTLASIFIYPHDFAFYGKLRYMLSVAEFIFPFIVFGLSFNTVRFYPQLQSQDKQQNFLFFSIAFLTSATLLLIAFVITLDDFLKKFQFYYYRWYVVFLAYFMGLNQILSKYISNLQRIVIPHIIENIFPKLAVISSFLFCVALRMREKNALLVFILFFLLASISLLFYLDKLQPIEKKNFFNYPFKKIFLAKVFEYGLYTMLGSVGSLMALRIDNIMIAEIDYLGEFWLGVYATLIAIVLFINIPAAGIYSIATPLLNKWMQEVNYSKINDLHQKSSFYLLLFGTLMFTFVLSIKDLLFLLMKNGSVLSSQSHIIFIIGVGILFDQATGFNGQILSVSKYFKWNIVFIVFLSIITIAFNYIFAIVLKMGLTGVAISSTLSLTIYNLFRLWFNYNKFYINPFSSRMISIVALFTIATGFVGINQYPNVFWRCTFNLVFMMITFVLLNLKFQWFPLKQWKNIQLKSLLGL